MKQVFKIAPLALAVAAFSMPSLANDHGSDGHKGPGKHKEGASLSKKVHVSKHVDYKGEVDIDGRIRVDSLGMAIVDLKQETIKNESLVDRVDNNATIGDEVLGRARGNIGVNISAGDNNVQSNSAALAAADASFAFGSADAEVFVDQTSTENVTYFIGTMNNAGISGSALANARGNIGVNVAAGAVNVQSNAFGGSVASGSMGEATSSVKQSTTNNTTNTLPEEAFEVVTTNFSVDGTLNGSYEGGGLGSYDTVGSSIDGTAVQTSAVYPEMWMDDGEHDNGDTSELVGHLDFDTENPSGGVFEFDVNGNVIPDSDQGNLQFTEAGLQSLGGTLSGSVDHLISKEYTRHENNASMSGGVLNSARGNIGVNVTAGANNLQNNSLALSRLNVAGAVDPTPGE
ncbi:hypothetical protein [Marinobacterium stanieri]|uniref:Adhesin n=1 Tax=Marinobacterium stanieri TaxID=49186 RepID=A0A1N6X7R5_9GAMM|nr:hypothetical protein [Marinobacterium stanieri]SIQ98365.1 hypothetical protein SAMN05421647_1133 [Marinobacterium stanieri]